jgi:hypothetical protein
MTWLSVVREGQGSARRRNLKGTTTANSLQVQVHDRGWHDLFQSQHCLSHFCNHRNQPSSISLVLLARISHLLSSHLFLLSPAGLHQPYSPWPAGWVLCTSNPPRSCHHELLLSCVLAAQAYAGHTKNAPGESTGSFPDKCFFAC